MTRSAARGLLVALLLAALPDGAWADGLGIMPTRVSIGPGQRSGSLEISNSSADPVRIQSQAKAWSGRNCTPQLEGTDQLVVSPPIFTIPPGGKQLVRIWPLARERSALEQEFRVVFREVLRQPAPPGMQVRLQMDVPVFVLPSVPAGPKPVWAARRLEHGVEISTRNDGNAHLRIAELSFAGPDGRALGERQRLAYVLPGDDCRWVVPLGTPAPASIRVSASIGGAPQTFDLPVP